VDDDRFRKRTATVNKANNTHCPRVVGGGGTVRRANTREELSKLRSNQEEMLRRWERDEDGWRELPARAWPEYQPNPEQLQGIQKQVETHKCSSLRSSQLTTGSAGLLCQSLLFNVATAQVFCNVDPESGFEQYQDFAQNGHVDSMVACGIILVEGLGGIRHREAEGVAWFGSCQALYELGTVYYPGMDGVVPEDSERAYSLFEKAAAQGHVGATYMMGDCLLEGEGTKMDVARAVPLLYQAADQGHRYARQRVRELLKDKTYQN
jgi:Sel1 repeat